MFWLRFFHRENKDTFPFCCGLFSVAAWIANRGIPHFIFASAPVVVAGFSEIGHAIRNVIARRSLRPTTQSKEEIATPSVRNDKVYNRFRIFIGAMVFAALLFLIASVITNHRYFRKFDNVPYPEGAVKFIKDKEIKGNMFNLHGWGGYIVWELFPPVRTYIDNRFLQKIF